MQECHILNFRIGGLLDASREKLESNKNWSWWSPGSAIEQFKTELREMDHVDRTMHFVIMTKHARSIIP